MGENEHLEKWYQGRIIKALAERYPSAFLWKAQAGPYARGGIPDICMVYRGHFFGFEVKRPKVGRLTPLQAATHEQIRKAGGTVEVVNLPEQALKIVQSWESPPHAEEEKENG